MTETFGTTIVAIPSQDDPVWSVSSEEIPHITLMFLGDQSKNPDLPKIVDFLDHVVNTNMHPFGLSVDRRGELGSDKADVLFFRTNGIKELEKVRFYLLGNPYIRNAYNSTEQFPSWIPHLTLGYPETPAKKPTPIPYISWVHFDHVSIWTKDFEGPTFRLPDRSYDGELETAMSGINKNELTHFGIKGMRWGVRRERPSSVSVAAKPGRRVKTSGGYNRAPSEDALRTASYKQVAKKSSTDALSTKELRELVDRMNLEQQYSRLKTPSAESQTMKVVSSVLLGVGKQQAIRVVNDLATKALGNVMKTAVGK